MKINQKHYFLLFFPTLWYVTQSISDSELLCNNSQGEQGSNTWIPYM